MARRRQYRGDDDGDLAEFAALQQQQDPRMGMAMQLLKMMEGQRSDVEDRAYKDRAMEAERMWREGQLEDTRKQESRLSAGAEEAKRQYEEEKKTREQQRVEDIAHRTEREKIEDTAKAATLAKAQKDDAIEGIDKMRARGIITEEEARARLEQIDPEQAAIAKGIKAQTEEAAFRKGLEEYKALPPKSRVKYTHPSPEVLQRIKDAVQGYQYEPGGPSAMPGEIIKNWKPQLEPAVSEPPSRPQLGNYGLSPVTTQGAAGYPAVARTAPAVGGMTEPVAVPPEDELQFSSAQQGHPSRGDYMLGVESPVETVNRIESDPRLQSAEVNTINAIKDWWNGPSTGAESSQPGFLDNLLRQISEYSASRPDRVRVERYPYPIGHGVPPTPPIDPSLLNPKAMPLGYGR